MLNKYINIGCKLQIRNKYENSKVYLSQIVDIKDKTNLRIYSPIYERAIVPLVVGGKYEVLFLTEIGFFKCDVIIKKRIKKEGFHFVDIVIISDLQKVQRRNYFRLKCLLDMKFKIIYDDKDIVKYMDKEIFDKKDNSFHQGVVKDISGGGMRFISNYQIESGYKVQTFINLSGNIINIISSLVHKQPNNHEYYKYEYRMKFDNITNLDKENIIKYIFEEQRRLMKKESGI